LFKIACIDNTGLFLSWFKCLRATRISVALRNRGQETAQKLQHKL